MDDAARRQDSEALHARARRLVAAFERGEDLPESLDALACDVARFQLAHSDGFARLSAARGVDVTKLTSAADIPAVPTDAFKLTRVSTFPEGEQTAVFRTSGTTVGARGEHAFRDAATYDAAAVAFGRRWLVRDATRDDARIPVVVVGPSPSDAPDSSLVHMCARFVTAFGEAAAAEETYVLAGDIFDLNAFDERVSRALARQQPMLVLGTSFAFVHLLDALGKDTFVLPRGSRVMQTGGFKGKSREVPADALRRDLARVFGIDVRAIVSEYGMTELSSQFYERTLFDTVARHGVYAEPPWARVYPVDPTTLAPVPEGEVGIAKIVDAMNVDSAVAVLTQDRVRRVTGGFELLGRLPGAPPRGCSIAIDELLGKTAS